MRSATSFTGAVPELANTLTDDSKVAFPRVEVTDWRANFGAARRFRALCDKV